MFHTYCPFLWNGFTIDNTGNVFSCCHIQPSSFGNVYHRKLKNLVNTHEIIEFRIKSITGNLDCFKTCNLFDKSQNYNFHRDPYVEYENMEILHIHFGNKCNINCIMCKHPLQFLNDSSLLNEKMLIKNVDISPFEDIIIQGGEPLFIENCIRYLHYLHRQGKKFILLTNGLLINEKLADMLSKSAKTVSISINANTKFTHEKVNLGSKFETVLNNIKKLMLAKKKNRTNCRLTGRMTITPLSLSEIPNFIQNYHNLGFDSINFGFDRSSVPQYLKDHADLKANLKSKITIAIRESEERNIDILRLKQLELI